jgi:isohexenylglutaconyl-CoA hydratase
VTLPTTTTLALTEDDGVLHVTLDRPDQRNAIDDVMAEELTAVFAHCAEREGELRAVVVRGAGGTFCAGGDLKGFATALNGEADRDAVAAANRTAGTFLTALAGLPQVTVAAVEGAAMGGGVGLAATVDVCLTTADARYSTTETTLGIVPAQIAPFLVRRLGATTTRRITLTAARFDGTEAARLGLADEVVPDAPALDAAVAAVLEQVRRCAPRANAATKRLVDRAGDLPLDAYLDEAAGVFADTLLGDEAREGVTAFVERRRPAWRPDPTP